MLPTARHLSLLCLSILISAGCTGDPLKHAGDFEYIQQFPDNHSGAIAASVNGAPIYAGEIKRHLSANPELSPREALRQLIDRELLTHKAVREIKGIYRQAGLARKRALVETLLDREFAGYGNVKKQRKAFNGQMSRWRDEASVKVWLKAWRADRQ